MTAGKSTDYLPEETKEIKTPPLSPVYSALSHEGQLSVQNDLNSTPITPSRILRSTVAIGTPSRGTPSRKKLSFAEVKSDIAGSPRFQKSITGGAIGHFTSMVTSGNIPVAPPMNGNNIPPPPPLGIPLPPPLFGAKVAEITTNDKEILSALNRVKEVINSDHKAAEKIMESILHLPGLSSGIPQYIINLAKEEWNKVNIDIETKETGDDSSSHNALNFLNKYRQSVCGRRVKCIKNTNGNISEYFSFEYVSRNESVSDVNSIIPKEEKAELANLFKSIPFSEDNVKKIKEIIINLQATFEKAWEFVESESEDVIKLVLANKKVDYNEKVRQLKEINLGNNCSEVAFSNNIVFFRDSYNSILPLAASRLNIILENFTQKNNARKELRKFSDVFIPLISSLSRNILFLQQAGGKLLIENLQIVGLNTKGGSEGIIYRDVNKHLLDIFQHLWKEKIPTENSAYSLAALEQTLHAALDCFFGDMPDKSDIAVKITEHYKKKYQDNLDKKIKGLESDIKEEEKTLAASHVKGEDKANRIRENLSGKRVVEYEKKKSILEKDFNILINGTVEEKNSLFARVNFSGKPLGDKNAKIIDNNLSELVSLVMVTINAKFILKTNEDIAKLPCKKNLDETIRLSEQTAKIKQNIVKADSEVKTFVNLVDSLFSQIQSSQKLSLELSQDHLERIADFKKKIDPEHCAYPQLYSAKYSKELRMVNNSLGIPLLKVTQHTDDGTVAIGGLLGKVHSQDQLIENMQKAMVTLQGMPKPGKIISSTIGLMQMALQKMQEDSKTIAKQSDYIGVLEGGVLDINDELNANNFKALKLLVPQFINAYEIKDEAAIVSPQKSPRGV